MSSVQEIKQEISELRAVYRDQTKSFFCKLRKLKKKLCTAQLDAEETSHLDMMMQNGIYDEEDDGMEDKDDSDSKSPLHQSPASTKSACSSWFNLAFPQFKDDSLPLGVAGGFKIMNQITKDALTTKPGLEPGVRVPLYSNFKYYSPESSSSTNHCSNIISSTTTPLKSTNDPSIFETQLICNDVAQQLTLINITPKSFANNILNCSEIMLKRIFKENAPLESIPVRQLPYVIMKQFLQLPQAEKIRQCLPINGRNYNDKSNSDVLNILQEQFNNSITKTDANDKIQPESIVGLNLYESSSDILDPFEVCKYTLLDLHANGISKSDYAENILGCSEDVFNEILQFDDSKTAKRLNTKYYFIMQYFLSLTVDERISLALNNLNDSDFDCDQSRFGVLDHGLREVERSCKGRAQYFREQLENLRNKEGLTEAESKERDEEEQILRNEITKVEQIYTSQVQLYSDNIRFLQNKLHEDQTLNMNPSETKFCVPFEVDYSFNVQEVTDEQSAFLWKLIEDSITKNKITRAEFAENILGVHPTTFSRMLMAKKPWRLYKRRERHFRIIQGWLKLSDSERVRVAKEKHTK